MRHFRIEPWLLPISLLLAVMPAQAQADKYPTMPIRMLVGFPPGGGLDVVARLVAQKLSARLGEPIIVENKPGATGTIASAYVAQAAPNGYTLVFGANSTNAIAPVLYQHLSYDSGKDLRGVALVAEMPHVISVYPGSGIHSLADFIAYAKRNPGKLTFSTPGFGSAGDIAAELFMEEAGVKLTNVPYQTTYHLTDLLAGRVTANFDPIIGILPYIKSGQLTPIAVTSAKRIEQLPNVPTADESGVHFEFLTWVGVFAPRNTGSDIVHRLNSEINLVMEDPDVQRKLTETLGATRFVPESAEQFDQLVIDDISRFKVLVKKSGLSIK